MSSGFAAEHRRLCRSEETRSHWLPVRVRFEIFDALKRVENELVIDLGTDVQIAQLHQAFADEFVRQVRNRQGSIHNFQPVRFPAPRVQPRGKTRPPKQRQPGE